MPRPKSELTKSHRAINVRVAEWQYQEWKLIGGAKWLREQLLIHKRKRENINVVPRN